jgi:predicted ATP-dependent protease
MFIDLFELSSYIKARSAIDFALKMHCKNYNALIICDESELTLESIISYLDDHIKNIKNLQDWVYVNNFASPHRPIPFALPKGFGIELKEKTQDLLDDINTVINNFLHSKNYLNQIEKISSSFSARIEKQIDEIKKEAEEKGFILTQNEEGFLIESAKKNKDPDPVIFASIKEKLNHLTLSIQLGSQKINKEIASLKKLKIEKISKPIFEKYEKEFGKYLGDWIESFRQDILENLDQFQNDQDPENDSSQKNKFIERYSINLIVNHKGKAHAKVIFEARPSYDNVFGSINYRTSANGGFETNFSLIRGGSLHYANGGILVLKLSDLLKSAESWEALKSALQNKKISIEEINRYNNLPLVDAPNPKAIPLDVQIFMLASFEDYQALLASEDDILDFFKVKSEIRSDMDLSKKNLKIYTNIIHKFLNAKKWHITHSAMNFLLKCSSRIVGSKNKLSSKLEPIIDILNEAMFLPKKSKNHIVNLYDLKKVFWQKISMHSHLEEIICDSINTNQLTIFTEGSCIGQINGLSVISNGEYNYGLPVRITARTYIGKEGIINIERLTRMGGAIQQKGAFVIEGFLKGTFGQETPASFTASLTFEQSYTEVDGDSASLAEALVIISSLTDIPIMQNFGVTGSIDQFGNVQSVGGVYEKAEGFFRVCNKKNLNGNNGIILPKSNLVNLTLDEKVEEAIKKNLFTIYPVVDVFEAFQIITGIKSFDFKKEILQKIENKLKKYYDAIHKKN